MHLGRKELEIKHNIYITKRLLRCVSAGHYRVYRIVLGHAYLDMYVVKCSNVGKPLIVVM